MFLVSCFLAGSCFWFRVLAVVGGVIIYIRNLINIFYLDDWHDDGAWHDDGGWRWWQRHGAWHDDGAWQDDGGWRWYADPGHADHAS